MAESMPTYEELVRRLRDTDRVFEALRSGQVDAIIGDRDVALVRLREAEEALRRLNAELEQRVHERTGELEGANRALGKALAELRDFHVRMMAVERLSALGTIAATIAHEVNNPLMGLQNALAFARRHVTEAVAREALEDAERDASRIAAIVETISRVARPLPKTDRIAVGDLLEQTLLLVRRDFSSQGIRIDTEIAPNLPPIQGDAGRLQQVFLNLLTNARDALDQQPDKRIRITASSDKDGLHVAFDDSGAGIQEELMERIFDPFFTTKPGRGTGLGLPIAKTIIEDMGGHLSVHSAPDRGTTFSLLLPIIEGTPEEPEGAEP